MATFAQFFQAQFTIDGALLTDGRLFHYAAGTSSDKAVWSDREKSDAEAQPLVPDGDGIFTCYADGLYKLVLTESDGLTVIKTWDDVMIAAPEQRGEGASIASASTLVLGTDGDVFHVTGTTTITAISGDQSIVTLVFDDTLTLTHSANLVLVGGIDFVTDASGTSVKQFLNDGGGVWREITLSLEQVVTDFKLKKDNPRVRWLGTEGSAVEYAITESAGEFLVQYNSGTEASPTWNTLGKVVQGVGWTFNGGILSPTITTPTITTPTIASFASATHPHLNAAGGGLLGASSVGTTQVKVTAQSHVTGSYTDNIGGTENFTVTGTRIGDFTIDPSSGVGGTVTLTQIHIANEGTLANTWRFTVAGDGTGAGTTTYTIAWNILGTVS